jgi:hypothetical protein
MRRPDLPAGGTKAHIKRQVDFCTGKKNDLRRSAGCSNSLLGIIPKIFVKTICFLRFYGKILEAAADHMIFCGKTASRLYKALAIMIKEISTHLPHL